MRSLFALFAFTLLAPLAVPKVSIDVETPAVVTSARARMLTRTEYRYRMRQQLAREIIERRTAPLLGGGQSSSCRVSTRPTDWIETRIIRPFTDPAPITTLDIDVCVYFEQTVAFEQVNELNPFGAQWYVLNMGIFVDASFDPNFTPGFEVAPSTLVTLPDVFGSVGAFDGVLDFGGTGGQSIFQSNALLVTATLQVSDDSFFRQPWEMHVRTRTGVFTQGSNAGAAVFMSSANAGIGIVVIVP